MVANHRSLSYIQIKEAFDDLTRRYYSLIAFDKRVTFWLHFAQSLYCACVYVALFACEARV